MQEMRRRNDPNFGKEAGKDAWKKADANKPGKGAAASKMSGQRCVQETCICVCGCVCGWVGVWVWVWVILHLCACECV